MTQKKEKFVHVQKEKVVVDAAVRNACQHDRDEDRERKRRKRLEEDGITPPEFTSLDALREIGREPCAGIDVSETVVRLFMNKELHKAVASLPEKKRKVIEMRYFDNLSVRDTATALGVPASTVQGREVSALTALKNILKKYS